MKNWFTVKQSKELLFLSFLMFCLVYTLSAQFAGGQGTENDPWQVETAQHLDNIRNYLGANHTDKYFVQTADIDLGVEPWTEGWVPIGTPGDNSFRGTYNGNGFTIENLRILTGENIGLFGTMDGGTLQSVGLENVIITGVGSYSGSLLGRSYGSTIKNCYSTGSFTSTNVNTGGFIGVIEAEAVIEDCWSDMVFSSPANQSAGFIGFTDRSTVRNCYNIGSVTITGDEPWYIGGFTSVSFMGTLINCYSRATVSTSPATVMVGGLMSYNMGSVTNCYAAGRITGGGEDVGGLVGVNDGNVTNSYWDREATGQNFSAGGTGKTTQEMTFPYDQNTYVNWDFQDIWAPDTSGDINEGYPILYYQAEWLDTPELSITITSIDGIDNAVISWSAVEGASLYYIYASDDAYTQDWGEPISITNDTRYTEPVDQSKMRFYYVVAISD